MRIFTDMLFYNMLSVSQRLPSHSSTKCKKRYKKKKEGKKSTIPHSGNKNGLIDGNYTAYFSVIYRYAQQLPLLWAEQRKENVFTKNTAIMKKKDNNYVVHGNCLLISGHEKDSRWQAGWKMNIFSLYTSTPTLILWNNMYARQYLRVLHPCADNTYFHFLLILPEIDDLSETKHMRVR